jgi:hypothetical protein
MRSRFAVLSRAFFAQFFAGESATSDEQVRHALIGALAFILTPCLLILIQVFPQFQLLVIRVGRVRPPPGAIVRATAMRNINGEDMLEWTVSILVAYSMVAIGLVAAWAWDALAFDRRDAMVLGPLPLRASTIVWAKLAALTAFLLGASTAVNLLNTTVFAIETSDQFGAGALVGHFVGGLVVTTMAAALVFGAMVTVRSVVAVGGGPRLVAATGSALQFAFVMASLVFLITIFTPPVRRGLIALPTLTKWTPTVWFVAWFETLRGSDRGSWPEFLALARRAQLAVALAVAGAVVASVVVVKRQMQFALTSPGGHAAAGVERVMRALARAIGRGQNPQYAAVTDFVLMTIARCRPQQAPIAVNAAIGAAIVVFAFARERTDAQSVLLAIPLVVAYWLAIGLRAAFFVPSELAAAWTFGVNARWEPRVYRSAVRTAAAAFILPVALAADAALVPLIGVRAAALHAPVVAGAAAAVVEAIILTITFVPFTRAYQPGHARLKTRWPLYLVGLWAAALLPARLARQALADPVAMFEIAGTLVAIAVALEYVGRRRAARWQMDAVAPFDADASETAVLRIGFVIPGASGS